jgi:chromosome segregation ATPase
MFGENTKILRNLDRNVYWLCVRMDSLLQAVAAIKGKVNQMSQVHDQLLALVQALDEETKLLRDEVAQLSAEKVEGQQEFQDVTTSLEDARNVVADARQTAQEALKDNATQGSSTGGGSGATQPAPGA